MIRESNRRNPYPNKHAIGAHALEMQCIKGKTSTNRVTQTYPHDDVMRLDKMSWTINGEVFTISQTYDALDR
ncbi:MAG TPA: hypothetical protein PK156_48880, partial [Polyangium sp.]|nr:hypothetical protein [Polyangium sp.]